MQRGIRIELAVEVVVVQAVDDAVGAHRQALNRGAQAADGVVQPAPLVQQVVRRVVRDHEQRMLARPDQDHRSQDRDRMGPEIQGENNRGGDHREIVHDCSGGAPGGAARKLLDDLARQRLAEVVLELLALHYLSMPPSRMYFTSRYSSRPYLEPSRPRPDCLRPPKGATSVEMMPTLAPTIPVSICSATRKIRPTSRL